MERRNIIVMPSTQEILKTMGEQIKLARLRRKISATLAAERASISRATLYNIEKGSASVTMGAYAAVLHALNNMDSPFVDAKETITDFINDMTTRYIACIERTIKEGVLPCDLGCSATLVNTAYIDYEY